ncbi:MAG TPA: hypothetical protein P5049_04710, partial [Methanothrix sp.]|nr:hypothetical protein [Methanothrix sp.]
QGRFAVVDMAHHAYVHGRFFVQVGLTGQIGSPLMILMATYRERLLYKCSGLDAAYLFSSIFEDITRRLPTL